MTAFRLLLIAALFTFTGASAFAAPGKNLDSPAAQFVQRLGDRALTSLTARDLSGEERNRRVRSLLRENFDIQTIGRFVLGTHWRKATEAQRSEYTKLFEEMIVRTYARRFAEYSGQSFKVTGTQPPQEGSNDTIVASKIMQAEGGPPVDVSWRVRDKGGNPKIVDVFVDGISMSVTQRSDFDAVIQQGGGNIEALLASLRRHQSSGKAVAK
jgi:phospholipid transport system substrate-binding protein